MNRKAIESASAGIGSVSLKVEEVTWGGNNSLPEHRIASLMLEQ